jgi:putative DNA primase/helicase
MGTQAAWQLSQIAAALGGEVSGHQVLAPGPGHSPGDRSLAVRPVAGTPEGFLTFSHCGDDWRLCRDHVRARLGISPPTRQRASIVSRSEGPIARAPDDSAARIERAVTLWHEGIDPRGTLVESYLVSRALRLPPELTDRVVRFHASCPWRKGERVIRVPAMLCVMRNIHSDAITAVQRTALTPDGRKIERRMLGLAADAAIKLDCESEVSTGLTIGEGFETCLAARQLHFRPVWAVGSVGAIARFPLLSEINALTILEETGDNGASSRAVETCGVRWHDKGREVFVATPRVCVGDVNDVLMKWSQSSHV